MTLSPSLSGASGEGCKEGCGARLTLQTGFGEAHCEEH